MDTRVSMKEKIDFVSIILPTFNRGEQLRDCVLSVINLTYKSWELIVCDDASTDDTGDVIRSMMNQERRIRYHRNPANQGLPSNRNVGISLAQGSAIFFIEDDVRLEPDCLEILVDTISRLSEDSDIGAVTPSIPSVENENGLAEANVLDFAWRSRNQELAYPCTFNPLTGVVRQNFATSFTDIYEVPNVHACSLYSRQALEAVNGYDEGRYSGNYLYEETDLNIRIRKKGYKLYFQPKAIVWHDHTQGDGGCRVNAFRYGFYFVLNHTKFVIKNFHLRAIWMVPSFIISTGFIALLALIRFAVSKREQREIKQSHNYR
jgi:GT2 family glycosyltransferase